MTSLSQNAILHSARCSALNVINAVQSRAIVNIYSNSSL